VSAASRGAADPWTRGAARHEPSLTRDDEARLRDEALPWAPDRPTLFLLRLWLIGEPFAGTVVAYRGRRCSGHARGAARDRIPTPRAGQHGNDIPRRNRRD